MFDSLSTTSGDQRTDESEEISGIADFDALITAAHLYLYELLVRIPAFDEQRVWFGSGAVSMTSWLTSRYRVSRSTAAEWVRVSYALADLPHLSMAFLNGALSWDQLRAVSKVATPETDADWANRAPEMEPSAIKAAKEPVPSEQVAAAIDRRSVRWWFREEESLMEMRVTMPDADGAMLATALMRRANQMGPDPITGQFARFDIRCADALIEMASQNLAADADHDRATILVNTDLSTILEGGGTSAIDGGPYLANDTLRRLTCDARLQMAVKNANDQVVGVGRTMRTPPPWMRRLVLTRDAGCRFPGCSRTRWLVVHHLIHWADGGPTDLDNLVTLCGTHHRLIHEQRWAISGDPNKDIAWLHPSGPAFQPVAPKASLGDWQTLLAAIPDITPPIRPWDTS